MHPVRPQPVTVVSLEQAVAAPFATRQLADLGARVIKIERPGAGDFARGYDTTVNGLSSYFVWLNRSKESLTLDLKKPGGGATCSTRCSRARMCSCRTSRPARPIASARSPADLRARYPRSSSAPCPATASSGPYADRKAYDLLVQSEVGLLSLTGTEDAPAKVGISVADIAAGMYAYSGILTALYARASHRPRRDRRRLAVRRARRVDERAGGLHASTAARRRRAAGPHHASIAPYGPVATRDGETVYLGDPERARVDALLRGRARPPELADDARFATNPLRVEASRRPRRRDRAGRRRAHRRPSSSRASTRRRSRTRA